ncbi:ATP synthase regulation protein NCA2-domain-containing protein [Sporodiniella umbellata]|nr:ATP synthase regulation protein NCA2-domain-containing protein [Sporodiniella umbellata]
MDTFISEQIKGLDSSLDNAFTKHIHTHATTQNNANSEFLLQSTQALNLSSVLPPLEKVRDYLTKFEELKGKDSDSNDQLEWLFVGKCALAVYGQVFSDVLNLTLPVSESIDYWNSIEGSSSREIYYALQTMPWRVYSLVQHIYKSNFQSFHKEYLLSQLFPSQRVQSFSARQFLRSVQRRPLLLEMVHEEIKMKRKALEKYRSEQAANLGMLLVTSPQYSLDEFNGMVNNQVQQSLYVMNSLLQGPSQKQSETLGQLAHGNTITNNAVQNLLHIVKEWPKARETHLSEIQKAHGIPSAWTRYWIPALLSYGATQLTLNYLLKRKHDIIKFTKEFGNTVHDFLIDWVWEPVRKVWETIRLKDQRLGLLSKQGLQSDIASLERMVVGFAKDNLNLPPSDLAKLTADIHEGDISVVLKEYEREIKSPLKNVIAGDLLRAMLIQVQKTKVDVDLAMSALDKLLKSNELNFAFLAVAPSMLLTWASASWMKNVFRGRTKQRVTQVGLPIRETLRRIDRQLIVRTPQTELNEWQTKAADQKDQLQADCETQGLLLCEIHLLRSYATALPTKNNMRARFLEDIRDLENANLTNNQKTQTIARMCRFWTFL